MRYPPPKTNQPAVRTQPCTRGRLSVPSVLVQPRAIKYHKAVIIGGTRRTHSASLSNCDQVFNELAPSSEVSLLCHIMNARIIPAIAIPPNIFAIKTMAARSSSLPEAFHQVKPMPKAMTEPITSIMSAGNTLMNCAPTDTSYKQDQMEMRRR